MRILSRSIALCVAVALAACSSEPTTAPGDAAGADTCPAGCEEEEGRWLHVSSLGVALSRFPGRSVLTRTLQVRISQGRTDVPWMAQSDQGWLSVTPSGLTGGSLMLTADPTGLAPGQLHLARVEVSSSDGAVRNQQVVRVGLWIGTADPQVVTIDGSIPNIVASPVEPHIYTNTAGTDITVYNIYSGAVAHTFASAVARAGSMAVSSDGAILFVNDDTNRRVVALDARTGAERQRYAWGPSASRGLGYARPDAHPILMTGSGKVFDVETGAAYVSRIDDGGTSEHLSFSVDLHSRYVYVQNHGIGPSTLQQYAIAYNALGADPLIVRQRADTSAGSYGRGICVSADGSRLYTANSAPYNFFAYGAEGLRKIQELPGDAYPNGAACGWNGLFFGSATSMVWAYRLDGTLVTTFGIPGFGDMLPNTLALSGDNTRIMASREGFPFGQPSLTIRDAPPP